MRPPVSEPSALSAKRVQAYFFLFGIAVLLPFNCILSAMDFMDVTALPGRSWVLIASPVYYALSVTVQIVLLFMGQCFTTWKIMALSCIMGTVCCVAFELSLLQTMIPLEARFLCAVVGCAGIGCAMGGLMQTSAGELAAKLMQDHGPLPAQFSNGFAGAGVMSAAVACSVSAFGDQSSAAKGLFALTGAIIICCGVALADLVRTGTLECFSRQSSGSGSLDASGGAYILDVTVLPNSVSTPILNPPVEEHPRRSDSVRSWFTFVATSSVGRRSPIGRRPTWSPNHCSSAPRISAQDSFRRVSTSVAQAWQQELNLMIIYVQTFIVFPAVCLKWEPPRHHKWITQDSYGLIMVSVYQVCDLLGRLFFTSPRIVRRSPAGNKLWLFVFSRTLLLPLFFICWLKPMSIFGKFAFQVALVALFAVLNGALSNLAFIAGASAALSEDRDIVGRALPLCVCVGILLGSTMSSASIPLIQRVLQ